MYIFHFIGRFSMDPNRVLDVILQSFESHFDQRHFFISLLRSYPCAPSTFINILGFKYHTYHLVSSPFITLFKFIRSHKIKGDPWPNFKIKLRHACQSPKFQQLAKSSLPFKITSCIMARVHITVIVVSYM